MNPQKQEKTGRLPPATLLILLSAPTGTGIVPPRLFALLCFPGARGYLSKRLKWQQPTLLRRQLLPNLMRGISTAIRDTDMIGKFLIGLREGAKRGSAFKL